MAKTGHKAVGTAAQPEVHADAVAPMQESTQVTANVTADATEVDGGGLLGLFWNLAAIEEEKRALAAAQLVRLVVSLQQARDARVSPEERKKKNSKQKDSHEGKPDATKEDVDPLSPWACDEIGYSLKRLVRGLGSSRDGARQGFALALTLLLEAVPRIPADYVLSLVPRSIEITGGMKGREERDAQFGRAFAYAAVIRSGRLFDDASREELSLAVKELVALSRKKSYLRELSTEAVAAAIEGVSAESFEAAILPHIDALVSAPLDEQTPESLSLALCAQRRHPRAVGPACVPAGLHCPSDIAHPSNYKQIAPILADSPTFAHPNVHSVWQRLIDAVLSPPAQGIDATNIATNITGRVQDAWRTLIDDSLLDSTKERKYLGFRLFEILLKRLSADDGDATRAVPLLFTPNLMRTLINNASTKDNYLHKSARRALQSVVAVATAKECGASSRLAVLAGLLGAHGNTQFDRLTGTKTVQSIVAELDNAGVAAYVDYLADVFLKQAVLGEGYPGDDEDAEAKASEQRRVHARREWAVDQLLSIVRNTRVPKTDAVLLRIVRFVATHSVLSVVEPTDDPAFPELSSAARPPVSLSTRTMCRQRLGGMLAELGARSPRSKVDDVKSADVKAPIDALAGGAHIEGTAEDGEFWVRHVNEFVRTATARFARAATPEATATPKKGKSARKDERPRGVIAFAETPSVDANAAMDALAVALADVRRRLSTDTKATPATPKKSKSDAVKTGAASEPLTKSLRIQLRSFELLFEHVWLRLLIEPADFVPVVAELERCYAEAMNPPATSAKTKAKNPSKKGKAEEKQTNVEDGDDSDERPSPVEVLADILLSFLAKPSNLIRVVVEQVFRAFCGELTPRALKLFTDVIQARDNKPGEEDLFETIDDDENGDDEAAIAMDAAAEGSEDDESDVAEEEDDEEEGGEDGSDAEDDDVSGDDVDSDGSESGEDAPVDPEFRARIKAALGPAAVDSDDEKEGDDDSSEEEVYNDEQMTQFDRVLEDIFKHKKAMKQEKRDARRNVLHFKMRVLDLVDIFIRRQSQNPLLFELITPLLEAARATANAPTAVVLHERILGLVKNKLCRVHHVPKLPALDVDRACDILAQTFESAKHASSGPLLSLATGCTALVLRGVLGGFAGPSAPAAAPAPTPKKKGKTASAAPQVPAVPAHVTRAAALFRDALVDFATKKSSHFQTQFFSDIAQRFPALVWLALPSVSETVAAAANSYRAAQVFHVLALLIKQRSGLGDKNVQLTSHARDFEHAIVAFLSTAGDATAAGDDESDGGNDTARAAKAKAKAKHLREPLVFALALVHLLQRTPDVKLGDVLDVNSVVTSVSAVHDAWDEQSPALGAACRQLLKALGVAVSAPDRKRKRPVKTEATSGGKKDKKHKKDKKRDNNAKNGSKATAPVKTGGEAKQPTPSSAKQGKKEKGGEKDKPPHKRPRTDDSKTAQPASSGAGSGKEGNTGKAPQRKRTASESEKTQAGSTMQALKKQKASA